MLTSGPVSARLADTGPLVSRQLYTKLTEYRNLVCKAACSVVAKPDSVSIQRKAV